ncbi:mucin-7-like [Hyalella azteca]|uniref:Mucin-7-like n=1 Tax=Hyalella azteca TaxID=294128 RepID=A0A8B7P3A1_HYAAZ|nr:mucin-7-like [Hyalella azteca]
MCIVEVSSSAYANSLASGQSPATTSQSPAKTSQSPATTSQSPATTSQSPATTSQPPATTSQPPATTSQPPATTSQSLATSRPPRPPLRSLHSGPGVEILNPHPPLWGPSHPPPRYGTHLTPTSPLWDPPPSAEVREISGAVRVEEVSEYRRDRPALHAVLLLLHSYQCCTAASAAQLPVLHSFCTATSAAQLPVLHSYQCCTATSAAQLPVLHSYQCCTAASAAHLS